MAGLRLRMPRHLIEGPQLSPGASRSPRASPSATLTVGGATAGSVAS
ncbi:hypothetical protein ACFPRL_04410 [Pseudoclavibacter helvolus]